MAFREVSGRLSTERGVVAGHTRQMKFRMVAGEVYDRNAPLAQGVYEGECLGIVPKCHEGAVPSPVCGAVTDAVGQCQMPAVRAGVTHNAVEAWLVKRRHPDEDMLHVHVDILS